MSRVISMFALMLLLTACADAQSVAQFWRPISEPNITMALDNAQTKLEYDLTQCHCGIFPRNVPKSVAGYLEPDKQRLTETSVATDDVQGQCLRTPSKEVGECMRARGWETTNCSGRVPTAGGAAVCAGYLP